MQRLYFSLLTAIGICFINNARSQQLALNMHTPATGNKVLSKWTTERKSDKVELQYRWVLAGDTLKTREVRAIFTVNAPHTIIIDNIRDPGRARQWNEGVKEFKIYPKSETEWFAYSLYKIPYPFTPQDLVTHYSVETGTDQTIIKINAEPCFVAKKAGVERQQNYDGRWVLGRTTDGKTRVEFYSVSYSKPVFPRFIQDPVIQRLLVNSFENFITTAENEKIRRQAF